MHQLDGVTYTKGGEAPAIKGRRRRAEEVSLDALVEGKRQRKERVVMVDGKGTGYGGAVPVLAEHTAPEEPEHVSAAAHMP